MIDKTRKSIDSFNTGKGFQLRKHDFVHLFLKHNGQQQIVTMTTVLGVGGPPGLFWGTLLCASCILCIAVSLAELASAYPTAGGVLDWAYEGSSKSSRKFVAWTTAWLNTFAWIVTATTWASLIAQQVLALAVLMQPPAPQGS